MNRNKIAETEVTPPDDNRFRDYAEVACDWFWETDSDYRFTRFSDWAGEDVRARIWPSTLRLDERLPDECSESWKLFLRTIQERELFRGHVRTFTMPDGKIRSLRFNGKPIMDADGTFAGYRGIVADITHDVLTENRARKAERRLADAMESSPEAFALYDDRDRLVMYNNRFRELFLTDIEYHIQAATPFEDLIRLIAGTGIYDHFEDMEGWIEERIAHHHNPGAYFDMVLAENRHLRVSEYRTGEGSTMSHYVDISDIRRHEAELRDARDIAERANKTKSEFLATVSHELRTPLNAIIGFSEIIRDELLGPIGNPDYVEYVRDIHASGAHLLELINDILDVSKAEAGKIELHEDFVDVSEAIRSAVRLIAERAEVSGVHVNVDIPDTTPCLRADERHLQQMLLNLLSNAVKFTQLGGSIFVKPETMDDGALAICVKDTGIGIAPEDMAQALMPFGQVDSALNRHCEGTGLGLPLTKKLVELHGGRLEINSTQGKGTEVWLFFPPERTTTGTFDFGAILSAINDGEK